MKYIKEYLDFNEIDDIDDNGGFDDFDGHEDFRYFLEENDVLDKYVENFYNFEDTIWKEVYWIGYYYSKDDYTLHDFLDELSKNGYKSEYIHHAFEWRKTEEGHHFWENINDNWKSQLNRYL
jgi:hypothetical protein